MTLGLFARGRQITAGSFLLAGQLVETHEPWQVTPPSPRFAAALHGWGWLDDLAAFGDSAARAEAQRWLDDWITRFGHGAGPGWQPDLAGRRLTRWLQHGLFLTAGAQPESVGRLLAACGAHAAFLARAHERAPQGLPRIEAQTGRLMAALLLRGLQDHAEPALAALTGTATALIAEDGGIPSRNPEELLQVFAHLGWCRKLLDQAVADSPGQPAPALPRPLLAAMTRAARALRCLRHADGGLARFQGGGAGPEGLLERSLAEAMPGMRERPALAMGYARLEGGRTSLIVDAAPPPGDEAAANAHAGTLGFELTSGRRPVIVSCGTGRDFGHDWWLGGRSTSAHSTLSLDGVSSARFGPNGGRGADREGLRDGKLSDGPRRVTLHRSDERDSSTLLMAHDGWVVTHGLTHSRSLQLSADGRMLLGSDELAALAQADEQRLTRARAAEQGRGLGFALRFHLHPELDASVDMQGRAVSIGLPSGEVWVFRFDGPAALTLEASVWLEPGRRAPRPARQIVLRAQLRDSATRINWTLAKGQDTPLAIRDVGEKDDQSLPADFFDHD